jgi:hypothetical protein
MSGKWISIGEATLRPLRESPTDARRRQGQPAAVRARVDREADLADLGGGPRARHGDHGSGTNWPRNLRA